MSASTFSDPEAEAFAQEVREWMVSVVPGEWRSAERVTRGGRSPEDEIEWGRIVSEGSYAGLTWPIELGGRGLGVIEQLIFFEEAAAAHAPDLLNHIGLFLAGPAIIERGTRAQQEAFLPGILSGETVWCEGFSEPEAGSDLAAVRTAAVQDGDVYRVNGQKIWTSNATHADRCYLLVKTSATERRHHNLSVLLLDMHQPGVDVRPIRQITDESHFSEVFFTDAVVPMADRLGDENAGWYLATLLGFRQDNRIVDGLRRYVQISAAKHQHEECRSECGAGTRDEFDGDLAYLNAHVRRCAELRAQGRDTTSAVTIIRLLWSSLWQRIAEAGFDLGCENHEDYWRDQFLRSRSGSIAGGTSQIQRNVIADRVLGLRPPPRQVGK